MGGRGFLSFVTRIYRIAGLQSGMVGRLFRKFLNMQGMIQMIESEEMRKTEEGGGYPSAVDCDHSTMAWSVTFKNELDKMDLHDFLRDTEIP